MVLFLFQLLSIHFISTNSFLVKRTLQQSLTIINYEMSDCDSPQNSGQVTIQLSSDIATETNNENFQGTLLSPSKKELKSTSCAYSVDTKSISCEFEFTEEGVYSLKDFTSNSYTYVFNIPQPTHIRIGVGSECAFDLSTQANNKRDYFFITTESCVPEIYIKKENTNTYYSLPCQGSDSSYKCSYPSNLEIKGKSEYIHFYIRGKCGDILESMWLLVTDISIEGDKYINVQNPSTSSYYYIITSSVEASFEFVGRNQKDIILLNNCITLQSIIPYKYNCTISNDIKADIYDLQITDEGIFFHEAMIAYEPDEIKIKSIELDDYSPSSKNKTATLQFGSEVNSIEDTFENEIRGIKLESNSKKALLNTCDVSSTNKTIIECKLIAEENCTLLFYYKNRTEHYVLINNENIVIRTGVLSYTDSCKFITTKLGILITFLIFFM